ncbi:hypothetical protein WUBG_15305, partial [Wuchereria bancrofti]
DKNKRHTQFDLAMDDDDNVQPDIFTDSGSGSYFREVKVATNDKIERSAIMNIF